MSFSGVHIGIVVRNDDPEYWGRVKVFVPEHAPNLENLKQYLSEGKTIVFNAIDDRTSPEFVSMLEELKELLPWAECAAPLCGGSSQGRFKCSDSKTSNNDSETFGENGALDGYRPLNAYVGHKILDDFSTKKEYSPVSNPYAGCYDPVNYSGMARGLFSIPNVGSQVYVFYLNNDPMYPVYFAASYGPNSIKQIYSMINETEDVVGMMTDYPAEFENSTIANDASTVFRSKTVLNSNKNTIELIDTDGFESLKLQHYSGSFIEMNNKVNIELAVGNAQRYVAGDSFDTVVGDNAESVNGDDVSIVRGNSYQLVGTDITEVMGDTIDMFRIIAEYKRLFPRRRTRHSFRPSDCSEYQTLVPNSGVGFDICPICKNKEYDAYGVNTGVVHSMTEGEETDDIVENDGDSKTVQISNRNGESIRDNKDDVEYGWSRTPRRGEACEILWETPDPYYKPDDGEEEEEEKSEGIAALSEGFEEHPNQGKIGVFGGINCPCCNNAQWKFSDETKEWNMSVSGYSPSTQDGNWQEETMLSQGGTLDLISTIMEPFVTLNERTIPFGGDKIETVSMSKVETIGMGFNDLPSYRVDPIGKLRLDGCYVTQQSVVPYFLPTPHVEYVDVDNIPGGDYILTVGNKWNVTVGSNGIIIQTTGGINIIGGITNFATQELNLSSKHDMMIDGGERLTLRARKITVNPVEHNALCIDGQLHVTRNAIIRGGMLVDGELAVQHITAPAELNATDVPSWGATEFIDPTTKVLCVKDAATGKWTYSTEKYGENLSDDPGEEFDYMYEALKKNPEFAKEILSELGYCAVPAIYLEESGVIYLPPHTHEYLQIPTSYKDCPNGVRASMITEDRNINSRQMLVAAKRRHNVGTAEEDEGVCKVYEENSGKIDPMIRLYLTGRMKPSWLSRANKTGIWFVQLGCYRSGNIGYVSFYSILGHFGGSKYITVSFKYDIAEEGSLAGYEGEKGSAEEYEFDIKTVKIIASATTAFMNSEKISEADAAWKSI